jgi:hypothetical protein
MLPIEDWTLSVPIKPREYLRRHGHRDRVGYSVAQPLLPKETLTVPDHPQNAPVQPGQGPPQQQQQGQQAGQPGQPQPQGGQPAQPAPQSPPPAGGDGGAAVLDLDHHAEAVAAAIRQQSQQGPPPAGAGAGADPGRFQQILGQIGQYGPFVLQFLESLVTKLQGGSQPTP